MSSLAEVVAQIMFKKSNSAPPKPPTQTRQQLQQQKQYPLSTTICCLSLHDTDKIRLINAPRSQSLISPLRQAIVNTWNQSIKHETTLEQCDGYEFKLKGKPWGPQSPKAGPPVASTNLVLALSKVMEQAGWSLIIASNVSHIREEKDSLFFERVGDPLLSSSREREPDEMTLIGDFEHRDRKNKEGGVGSFVVELLGYDTIHVTEAPAAIIDPLRLAILKHWTQGIEKEGSKGSTHEFTLTGCPFRTWGSETSIETVMMMIQMWENMRQFGFKLDESVDRNAVGKTKQDKKVKVEKQVVDSWVLQRFEQM
ncbi:hypothetical protein KI688_009107 [Linnemannia hyalina]|uniref:Uncharacterized protein n=1 Tax=Linnemannia hyalina TaxID=64524 RepID=A0A9P7XZ39_9FUNG|nr:hypothetical protein KI688_009107 [Linnemannia hyalina]